MDKYNFLYKFHNKKIKLKNMWDKTMDSLSIYLESIDQEYDSLQDYERAKESFLQNEDDLIEVLQKKQNYNMRTIRKMYKESDFILSYYLLSQEIT